MARPLVLAALPALAFAVACGHGGSSADDANTPPSIDDVSSADATSDVVDRAAELAGAQSPEDADEGQPLDMTSLPAGFALKIDSKAQIQSLQDDVPSGRSATYQNVLEGVALAAVADTVTALVVLPPAGAIDVVAHGAVTPVSKNVWVATNTVSDGVRSVTGNFVVAWVGVGWVAEMRLTSSDGTYNNTKWFDGFLSADHGVGWWDLYDQYGTQVGVVEWLADGAGNAEFGIGALSGDNAGDTLVYLFGADGAAAVDYHDASAGEDAWVHVQADQSGEVRAPDYAGGVPSCWAAADDPTAPYADSVCDATDTGS